MTTVQNAVARTDEQRAQAPAQVSQAAVIRQAIERQSEAFRQVLPSVVEPDRFSRLTLTAIKSTPDLLRCFETPQGQTSVLLSAMQAAAVGLEPNTPTQECWLLPRRAKGVWECQLSIGYRGYLRLARRSGTIKTIFAEVVREGDEFRYSRGLEADELVHKPLDNNDGDLTHAYAVVRFTNGGYNFVVLNRRQVEKRRASADSYRSESGRKYSPWVTWEEEMWRKSAIRALVPSLDLSPEIARALSGDERPLVFNDDDGIIDVDDTGDALDELEPPPTPPGAAADDGDRQEPASPGPAGEEEPAADGTHIGPAEGSSPATDGTVDPSTWTGDEWRAQLSAHKRKPADAIREAQRLAGELGLEKPPGVLDDVSGNADLAVALYTWMTTK